MSAFLLWLRYDRDAGWDSRRSAGEPPGCARGLPPRGLLLALLLGRTLLLTGRVADTGRHGSSSPLEDRGNPPQLEEESIVKAVRELLDRTQKVLEMLDGAECHFCRRGIGIYPRHAKECLAGSLLEDLRVLRGGPEAP